MASQSLPPGKTNFARLVLAFSDVCTKSLRVVLLRNVPSQDIKQAIVVRWGYQYNSPKFDKYPYSALFPNHQLDPNFSVSDCDLSLLYFLIRNVSSVQHPSLGWGKSFMNNPQDTSIGANVERLHLLRNDIIHLKEPILSNQEFNSYWNKLKDCVTVIDTYLGSTTYQQKLDCLKTADMDPDYANRIIETFLSSLQDLRARQLALDQTLSDIRGELNQGFHDIKTAGDRTIEGLSEVKGLIKDENRQLPQIAKDVNEMKDIVKEIRELIMEGKAKEDERTQPQLNSDQGVITVNSTSNQNTNGGEEIGASLCFTQTGSLENITLLSEIEVSQRDLTEPVFVHKMLAELANSVGIIKSCYASATGFRVGPNYVMTTRSFIAELIMRKGPFLQQQQPQLLFQHQLIDDKVSIDFCYKWNNLPSGQNGIFYFEPEIVYESVYLDTAILKLKPDTKVYPPPLTKFISVRRFSKDLSHGYIIGHSLADIKKADQYQIVLLTQSDIDSAKEWSMHFANENGYDGIEDQHRVLFHCSFEKGAAGSPGFWINPSNGQAYVELMLLCGYPKWYYDKYEKKGNNCRIPNNFFVEQGVSMKSVYDDLKERDQLLCNTIFGTR